MQILNHIKTLPWHATRRWQSRSLDKIDKIIIHQELGESNIEGVNAYHIGPNHISKEGCPHFCYHYGIEKDGTIKQANELSSVTWHTTGQNTVSVGIMLVGNFNGTGYNMGKEGPTPEQLASLEELVKFLKESLDLSNQDVFGHYHFGKPACPGYKVSEWIETLRSRVDDNENSSEAINNMTLMEYQARLQILGYYSGKVDGIMGPLTKRGTYLFQQKNGLLVDGIIGPQTKKKLVELTPNYKK